MAELKTTVVIFGASGDLTQRKLLPSLFNLNCKGRLPERLRIVGYARRPWTTSQFRETMKQGLREFARECLTESNWKSFAGRLHYVEGGLSETGDYRRLSRELGKLEVEPGNRLFYLATPPEFFPDVVRCLSEAGMVTEDGGWRRVVVEKPFGRDLRSARDLNRCLHDRLKEPQIFRIDHYLAKETVQNILVFRFGNTIFEPIWSRNYIDHVQISALESVDVEHRAGYYDQAGVLRDMFQNHLLQLLALVSMEPPSSFEADALRNEKVKVLSSVRGVQPEELLERSVRGQYRGYREAARVEPGSETPTYAALKLFVDNWRWQGVPFYLRSGKALTEKGTEIVIQFKEPPHSMFPLPDNRDLRSNLLALCIQPHEGIHLRFEAKIPDTPAEMKSVHMDFHYDESFGKGSIPEAYERLLLNALEGDASLFSRSDGIEASWRIIDPFIEGWQGPFSPSLAIYEPGSWGPLESDEWMRKDGRRWRYGCGEH